MPGELMLVEGVDFRGYPPGGQTTRVNHYLRCLSSNISLVGMSSAEQEVGQWSHVLIGGRRYRFFSVACVKYISSRPWVPRRLAFLLGLLRFADEIRAVAPEGTLTISPEAAIGVHWLRLPKCLYESSGVSNCLLNSRYGAARYFARAFERVLFNALRDWPIVMAAADEAAIAAWVERSEGRLDISRIRRTHTSYDGQVFHPLEISEVRRQIGIDERDTVITWVGRLNWVKNWRLAVNVFGLFVSNHPDSKLLIVGDGEDRPECEQLIADLGLTSKVILTGFIEPDRVSVFVNAANVFLLTSWTEGWPTAVVEALACGRPVVSTAVSGAREMIVQGLNGCFVESPSAEQLCDGLERALAIHVPSEACLASAEPYSLAALRKSLQDYLAEYEGRGVADPSLSGVLMREPTQTGGADLPV